MTELEHALKTKEDDFLKKYEIPKPQRNDKLGTHCMIGGRAKTAGDILKRHGFINVIIYLGSFKDWKEKGGEIEEVSI